MRLLFCFLLITTLVWSAPTAWDIDALNIECSAPILGWQKVSIVDLYHSLPVDTPALDKAFARWPASIGKLDEPVRRRILATFYLIKEGALGCEDNDWELCQSLTLLFPADGIISKGVVSSGSQGHAYTWVVDPFGEGKECAHFGLVDQNGQPIFGVNYYHLQNLVYMAMKGRGAFRQGLDGVLAPLHIGYPGKGSITPLFVFDEETEAVFHHLGLSYERPADQNVQLKVCSIADGLEPLVVMMDPKSCSVFSDSWDWASSQVIITEAGGVVTTWSGEAPSYSGPKLESGIIVCPNRTIFQRVVSAKEAVAQNH